MHKSRRRDGGEDHARVPRPRDPPVVVRVHVSQYVSVAQFARGVVEAVHDERDAAARDGDFLEGGAAGGALRPGEGLSRPPSVRAAVGGAALGGRGCGCGRVEFGRSPEVVSGLLYTHRGRRLQMC